MEIELSKAEKGAVEVTEKRWPVREKKKPNEPLKT